MNLRLCVVAVGLFVPLVRPAELRAQESIAAARQLYASAEYKDALTMLDGLLKSNPAPQDRQAIDLYRTFCLAALGGVNEATTAVDEMIKRDPLYHPNLDEVPPRLRTLFKDARQRLLPGIIQQRYVAAKAAFERNDLRTATEGFTLVLIALSDPDIGAAAGQAPLADLKTLATGFNDLAIRNLAPPPTPQVASAPAETPAPIVPPPAAPAAAAAASASLRAPAIYTKDEPDIIEPTAVRQSLPPYPGRVTMAKSGVLEIVIDETGSVEFAAMVQPIDPSYNRLVIAAAKTWTYRPARRDGTPVKFRKRIQVAINPGS
jgi:hypothetical protein